MGETTACCGGVASEGLTLEAILWEMAENPKKHPEKTRFEGFKRANKEQRKFTQRFSEFASNRLNTKKLFRLGILLDTLFPRPYYAARKF
jgi:hypothetical protein